MQWTRQHAPHKHPCRPKPLLSPIPRYSNCMCLELSKYPERAEGLLWVQCLTQHCADPQSPPVSLHTSMAMAGLCSTSGGSRAGCMPQRCRVCSSSWISWIICTACPGLSDVSALSSQGLNGDADVPDMTNRVRGSAELLLQRKTALWDFIVPAQLSWDTWARYLQLQCHHCDLALAYACDVSSPYKDWTLLSARFTLCWSIGSKGPSKAAAMMPFPSVMLLSATSSGSTSGMEGSREHHSAWPAHSQKDSSAQERDGLREQPLAETESCNVTEDAPSKGLASSNAALADSLLP